MYESYFGLSRRPFAVLPDSNCILWTEGHRNAASAMNVGLDRLSQVSVLTGGIGTGKTTLIRHLLQTTARDYSVGLLSNFSGDRGDLLRWLLSSFDQDISNASDAVLVDRLEQHLRRQAEDGRRSVLIVDEAQNLSTEDLENLRLLSNLNADQVLLMLILVGQPQLRAKLTRIENRQICQRIGADYHIDPLAPDETKTYVRFRCARAGGRDDLFDEAALDEIHRASSGIPRKINVLCDLSLVSAYADEVLRVSQDTVRSVLEDARRNGTYSSLTEREITAVVEHDIAVGAENAFVVAATDSRRQRDPLQRLSVVLEGGRSAAPGPGSSGSEGRSRPHRSAQNPPEPTEQSDAFFGLPDWPADALLFIDDQADGPRAQTFPLPRRRQTEAPGDRAPRPVADAGEPSHAPDNPEERPKAPPVVETAPLMRDFAVTAGAAGIGVQPFRSRKSAATAGESFKGEALRAAARRSDWRRRTWRSATAALDLAANGSLVAGLTAIAVMGFAATRDPARLSDEAGPIAYSSAPGSAVSQGAQMGDAPLPSQRADAERVATGNDPGRADALAASSFPADDQRDVLATAPEPVTSAGHTPAEAPEQQLPDAGAEWRRFLPAAPEHRQVPDTPPVLSAIEQAAPPGARSTPAAGAHSAAMPATGSPEGHRGAGPAERRPIRLGPPTGFAEPAAEAEQIGLHAEASAGDSPSTQPLGPMVASPVPPARTARQIYPPTPTPAAGVKMAGAAAPTPVEPAQGRLAIGGPEAGPARRPPVQNIATPPPRTVSSGAQALAANPSAVSVPAVADSMNEFPIAVLATGAPAAAPPVVTADASEAERLFRHALEIALDAPTDAVAAYAEAAIMGHSRAAYYLGQIYETGDGVPIDFAAARHWYGASADSNDRARERLGALPPPDVQGAMATPVPLLARRSADDRVNLVWTSGQGADPASYLVEFDGDGPAAARAAHLVSASAARLPVPAGASRWRVMALDPAGGRYAVSSWQPIGDEPEVRSIAPTAEAGLQPSIAIAHPASASSEAEALLEALRTRGLQARLATAGPAPTRNEAGIRYFYGPDAGVAAAVAELLTGHPTVSRAPAALADGSVVMPGQVLVVLGPP